MFPMAVILLVKKEMSCAETFSINTVTSLREQGVVEAGKERLASFNRCCLAPLPGHKADTLLGTHPSQSSWTLEGTVGESTDMIETVAR